MSGRAASTAQSSCGYKDICAWICAVEGPSRRCHRANQGRFGPRAVDKRTVAASYSTCQLINQGVEYRMAVDQLSTTFAALADPTRRAILARLASGEATVNELAEEFPVSLQAASKHLKVLERAGLITRGRTAQWRPSPSRRPAAGGSFGVGRAVPAVLLGERLRPPWRTSPRRTFREDSMMPDLNPSRVHHHSRLRCAEGVGVPGVDPARAPDEVVGPARLHHPIGVDQHPTRARVAGSS